MSTQNEYLQQILTAVGGNINDLPDNLKSTLYTAIILKCGGTVDDLPDRLESTYLKRIAECVSGGGGARNTLQEFLDDKKKATYLFYDCGFSQEMADKYIPMLDFSNVTDTGNMFVSATMTDCPSIDIRNSTTTSAMFNGCAKLKTIAAMDLRKAYVLTSMFNGCVSLEDIRLKHIRGSLQVASGTSWGHLLTVECLIHLIKELRRTGSLLTLTIGNANLEKLANVYVRIIPITDEMRAEDEFIDDKLPFEVCESTDEGAQLIVDYAQFKNWEIN